MVRLESSGGRRALSNEKRPDALLPERRTALVRVLPGDVRATAGETLVTVLGSCVAVCLWDPTHRVAGMNHFMLPGLPAGAADDRAGFYGAHSMELLITALQKRGARRGDLEAKVFGGGSVLDGLAFARVGERNVAFVLEYLESEEIPVVAQDVLGSKARKLVFETATNTVHVRYVTSHPIDVSERALLDRPPAPFGRVELFEEPS